MPKKSSSLTPVIITAVLVIAFVAVLIWYMARTHLALLEPAGAVAQSERNLLILVTALSMIIIIPVFALTIFVAWKYREENTAAPHSPNWDYKPAVDVIWWTVPTIIIIVISVIIWQSTYALDPYKPVIASGLSSQASPGSLTIQVVALDWKWLFIYPDQGIATVGFFQFPENTPVNFDITSDAPMNSFWIPELGSQIYAMPGMTTQLHLIASSTGEYPGWSANISGAGFSGMTFTAKSSSAADFETWAAGIRASSTPLDAAAYNDLAKPSTNTPVTYYSLGDGGLYDKVLMKDMMEADGVATDTMDMSGMNMDAQQ
jgi:cytochrome o ubiquinol oxidase subunit II